MERTNSPLKPQQLAELRALLVEKRDALLKGVDPRGGPREQESDEMDAASDATADAEAVALSEHDREMLREVDAALERMDRGTYGLSEVSEEPIGFPRLKAVPWTRYTVQEAEEEERRRRR